MIGILGGTFDPIHHGHLRPAMEVAEALGLERIRLIPLRDPPHRERPEVLPAQRLEMVQAAVADEPLFQVDDRELRRPGKSYTLDTLRSLRQELGEEPMCLLLGSDAFRGLPDWHQPDEVLKLVHIVVMQRPGERPSGIYPERVVVNWEEARSAPDGRILFTPVTQLAISATRIRTLAREGRNLRYLLPQAVINLIECRGYYRQAQNPASHQR